MKTPTHALLIAALASRTAHAFAPLPPHHPTRVAVAQAQEVSSPTNAPGFTPLRTPNTALYAGSGNLFDRFFRVTRGNLNNLLSQFEDPEKVMDQAVVDMQNDLVQIRQAYAQVTASQRRLANSQKQQESVAKDWYRRAQLALKKGEEDLARQALARREQALQAAQEVENEASTQSASLDKLYEGMKQLEAKIVEAQSKKSQLAARAKTAKNTQKVNDMLAGLQNLGGKTSMAAFARMEEKVNALEAAAEVSADFLKNNENMMLPASSSIEKEFRRLEASDAVDRELEKLQMDMKLLSSSSQQAKQQAAPATKIKETVKVPVL